MTPLLDFYADPVTVVIGAMIAGAVFGTVVCIIVWNWWRREGN